MSKAHSTLFALGFAGIVLTSPVAVAAGEDKSTVGQYIDDATITTRVKASFAEDPVVSAMAVSVETVQGTVQLSGFVKTEAAKAKAEEIARKTPGVTKVRNNIVVRP